MGHVNDNVVPELPPKHQLEDCQHRLERVVHPFVLPIAHKKKGVDIRASLENLNYVLNVLGVHVVGVIKAWCVDDGTGRPSFEPGSCLFFGFLSAGVGFVADFKTAFPEQDVSDA